MPEIILPHNFEPRIYQLPFFSAMDSGYKRAILVWHRRAGKDKSVINLFPKKMVERVGGYYHFFPFFKQARKAIWEGRDKNGMKFTDHFPQELIRRRNEAEMLIEFKNGSIYQLVGTDNYDSVMSTNPVGCVFDEYSIQDPGAWDYIRPILAENDGWAVFCYTPRGKNHGFDLNEMAKNNPAWFHSLLTVNDTKAIDLSVIEDERKAGMSDEMIQQEFFCSFEAPNEGSYYGRLMGEAAEQGRICSVPYDPNAPVETIWDLGMSDSTSIWFRQRIGREWHYIDFHEANGEGLQYYVKLLHSKGYIYSRHIAPHDIMVRELGTGKSRREVAAALGLHFRVEDIAPRLPVQDGIEAVRSHIPMCWFDKVKCSRGIKALISYHKSYDEEHKQFRSIPEHDWSSHAADSFRYGATSRDPKAPKKDKKVEEPALVADGWMR